MTEEYWQNLGRRAVTCKAWRWMRGMAADDGCSVAMESDLEGESHSWSDGLEVWCDDDLRLPDLTDPATVGCLLALVRDAWGDDGIATMRAYAPDMAGQWSVYTYRGGRCLPCKRQATEAMALVAALEAAP